MVFQVFGFFTPPFLIADDRYLAINGRSDLPGDWNARELACAAAWHGPNQGGVLAVSGSYFEDPYVGATGVEWPGIAVNRQLAANVLQYLAEGRPCDTPEDYCQRVEINLADFVFGTLKASDATWWDALVPENVRRKCADRRLQERGRFPVEAYCDLIDLKTVIEKNWGLFGPCLRAVTAGGGKTGCLNWITKLNELRRLVGHPLKKHISGYAFSADDRALLRHADELARRLRSALPGCRRGTV